MKAPTSIDDLKRHLRMRFLLLLAATTLFGSFCNWVMLHYGVASLVIRSGIALITSYVFFFVAVRIWLSSQLNDELIEHASVANEEAPPKGELPKSARSDWWYWPDLGDLWWFILIILVVIILYMGISWVIVEGPFILAEAAVEFAFFGGLMTVAKRRGRDWYERVFRRTIGPFIVLLLLTLVVTGSLGALCPGQNRLYAMVKQCHHVTDVTNHEPAHP